MGTWRMTIPTRLVLQVMLSSPGSHWYGLEIGREAGLRSGTIHPILARLERRGWITSEWEEIDPKTEGRPRRRYYQLTGQGVVSARTALEKAFRSAPDRNPLRPAPEGT